RRRRAPADQPPVRPPPRAGPERRARALAGGADGEGARREPGGLRPQRRRPRLAHPRRHRGRPAASPAHPDRARGRVRVRAPPGRRGMRRLCLQVSLAFLAILVVFAGLVAAAWHHGGLGVEDEGTLEGAAALVAERLPAGADPPAQAQALAALATRLRLN